MEKDIEQGQRFRVDYIDWDVRGTKNGETGISLFESGSREKNTLFRTRFDGSEHLDIQARIVHAIEKQMFSGLERQRLAKLGRGHRRHGRFNHADEIGGMTERYPSEVASRQLTAFEQAPHRGGARLRIHAIVGLNAYVSDALYPSTTL